jgi:dihydroflavonol-4-reductase
MQIDSTTNRTVAVTGATGHLGWTLCQQLSTQGFTVRALVHENLHDLDKLNIEIIRGDILKPDSLEPLLAGADYLIHAAAAISINGGQGGTIYDINVEGTRNVMTAGLQAGVRRFLHISSTHAAHETPQDSPYDELRPYKTRDDFSYDWSKSQSEQWVLQFAKTNKVSLSVIRPSCLFGQPDPRGSLFGQAMIDLYRGALARVPTGGYDVIDVRDAAATIIRALDRARDGEVYLVSGKYYSMRQLAELIATEEGACPPPPEISIKLLFALLPLIKLTTLVSGKSAAITYESLTALKNSNPIMNNAKACRELGHEVRPIEASIGEFFAWHNNGEATIEVSAAPHQGLANQSSTQS